MIDENLLRRAPKVLLHDHLDGGLRPATVLELAAEAGHELPAGDERTLARWFDQGQGDVDLPGYLEAFAHTVAVMQTPEAISRVARECAEDLDADGVVYAEVRFAPELSTAGGLSCVEVIEAIAAGFAAGPDTIVLRQLVCALRHEDRWAEAFEAAAETRHLGVVGIDLAGPEAGFPAARHARTIERAREAGLQVTLHAGEADGPDSIADALDQGAQRLGHGLRIIDDIAPDGTPGPVASRVLAAGIPLELCPTSNVHTGAVRDLGEHPIARLDALGFGVTLNTDNRLMSDVTATSEAAAMVATFGVDLDDLERWTSTAVAQAFVDETERAALLERVRRGYAALRP
ncbi:MAG: adenosine deaminase [Nitriliruptoraceae bacterium]|nr:adenosine deaminase [Nitriliruptoraceae bacterium]